MGCVARTFTLRCSETQEGTFKWFSRVHVDPVSADTEHGRTWFFTEWVVHPGEAGDHDGHRTTYHGFPVAKREEFNWTLAQQQVVPIGYNLQL